MPFLAAAIFGGALMAGGAVASGMGQRARRKALSAMGAAAVDEFRGLGDEYRDLFSPIMRQYTREREQNMALYRTEMQRAEESFSRYFEQARSDYGSGMDRALGEMRIGRESTIEATRQETRKQQAAQTASNAFTGLGQTTFGQQRVQNIGSQGSLREGMIREQYAGQLSALEAQRAQGMSTLSAQMGQGLSGIQQSLATNLSNIYQTYSGNIANMQMQGLGQQFNIYQQGMNIGFQAKNQAANLAGAGVSAAGSAMGSMGGALFGAGLGGMMAPPAAAAGGAAGNWAGSMQSGGMSPSQYYQHWNQYGSSGWNTQGFPVSGPGF